MTDFFAKRLLGELDSKPALEALEESILESRKVGFDYVDDKEALEHFRSEIEEFEEAFASNDNAHATDEAGDIQLLLVELVRRRRGSLVTQTRETTRKFLKRLEFVEQKIESQGKTWANVQWPDDIKPLWAEAKKAGL